MATALKNDEIDVYRDTLLDLRARLRGDVEQMTDEALGGNGHEPASKLSTTPLHMADIGTENYEQEFTLGLIENDSDTIAKIDSALSRIAKGQFGRCEDCGGAIPKARLQALPYANTCIECARQREEGRV